MSRQRRRGPVQRRWWFGLALLALGAAAAGVLWSAGHSDGSGSRVPTGPFFTAQPTNRALVWAVGDGANGSAEAKALARRIARSKPDLFLYLGDVYEEGTASEFARNYAPVYGRFARFTAPTPGDHEWSSRTEGYEPYWRRVRGIDPPAYYSFSIAGWQILSLNSEEPHDTESPQLAWLRRQVRGPGTCRLAFWHRARYSAGTKHGDKDELDPLWSALRGRARIVVTANDHDMQRHAFRDGIVNFVSGAGGSALYPIDSDYPGLVFGNDDDFGALRIELRPGTARFAFVTSTGRTVDSGRINCRRR